MNKIVSGVVVFLTLVAGAQAKSIVPAPPEPPVPTPVFRPALLRENEKPVIVETAREIVAENALYSRVATTITFTNPNERAFEGELEFPLPNGATVTILGQFDEWYTVEYDGLHGFASSRYITVL